MYDKIVVKLIIGNIETSIDLKVGVKQGDRISPVLFLFLMMTFSENLEDEWTALGLSKSQFSHIENSPTSTGKLVSHRPGTFTSGMLFYIFCMIYVYGGEFIFESGTDTKRGMTLLSDHFVMFSLEMHIRTGKKPSKT